VQHFVVSLQFHVQLELQPPKAVNQHVAGGALSYPLKREFGGGRSTRTQGIWLNAADCFAGQKEQKAAKSLPVKHCIKSHLMPNSHMCLPLHHPRTQRKYYILKSK